VFWLLLHTTPHDLLEQGCQLGLAGRHAEAEQCFRTALATESRLKPRLRSRLLGCLGETLGDMGRYPEARQYLEAALAIGDPTGCHREALAGLLLLQGTDPRKALEWAEQAVAAGDDVYRDRRGLLFIQRNFSRLSRADRWLTKAWALAVMGRQAESLESIELALGLAITAHKALVFAAFPGWGRRAASVASVGLAGGYWRTGMARLAMGQTDPARSDFQNGANTAPRCKYAARCRQQLERLGASVG
jgi:tetratricopeptide (TPR) repeat protein